MESDYVLIDNLELSEESEYKGVMYCDKPFTGTAYDDWQDAQSAPAARKRYAPD